ncbi:hypothetical protein CN067_34385 [Sinorhizobium meliloti]|uniref:hypothetical protein n=1 Tax=Rhizobium meliloti TaxID=382 RepID=UPI000FDA9A35|nr:hypothetical protein [Sinorhizobium meliloti]RVQ09715.1 hypothetical protein CN067_34385 [Sinorhizobium meliloti]
MAMLDIKSLMHSRIDEMFATISGQASDEDCQFALKRYLMSNYSDLASLSFWLGCDAKTFQDEAVPAADIVDDAFFDLNREAEFEAPAPRQTYSALNSRQQFGAVVEGASL